MALTGVFLVVFVLLHLAGNLFLYKSDGGLAFNAYAAGLDGLGNLKTIAEIGLVALFGAHIVLAVAVKKSHVAARPVGYRATRSKRGHSRSNLSSRNMIVTGSILLAFLVLHILQFRLGPEEDQGYVTQINGHPAHDLYRVVFEAFQRPWVVGVYVAAMLMLGFHLRHGFWSAFQSLGAMNARFTKPVYALGVALAVLLAVGFLGIPVWMHFGVNK
jgi:succinate dehydrogenase / fumarate reductase cytochrome b subunit